MTEHDGELERRFHALRREDAAGAPPFGATLAAARARGARSPHRRMLGLAAAAVIAGFAVAFLSTRPGRRGVPNDLATVRWETPTDFLLALPNEDLLRTVPELGRVRLSGTGLITTN